MLRGVDSGGRGQSRWPGAAALAVGTGLGLLLSRDFSA